MLKLTLRNLGAHRRRLFSTFSAVLLGVSFLAGTLVLTDTIDKTFDELFADATEAVDTRVRLATSIEGDFGDSARNPIDASLLDTIRSVEGVAAADVIFERFAQIIDPDGDPVGDPDMGPPTFGANWPEVEELNPFDIAEGRAPETDTEVVIDKASADDAGYEVGDTAVVDVGRPIAVTIVGIATFGDADSPGGASFTFFTRDGAELYFNAEGQADAIDVVAADGVSEEELRDDVAAVLPSGVEAITGEQLTQENQDDIEEGLSFFSIFLIVFAAIAVVVATFSIYNTFSIIVAQRTREMALLRALGASRSQVMRSVLVEALLIGVVATLVGLLAGVGVAGLLKGLLAGFGFDLPAGGLVITTATIAWSVSVGIVVTLIAAAVPAVKAARIRPMAALRDAAIDTSGLSKPRMVIGALMLGVGVLSFLNSFRADEASDALAAAGTGGALLLFGTIVLGPTVAAPVSRVLAKPVAHLRGVSGRLAQENAARNPRRTAGSAAALLIGVAIVTLFTVFAASIKGSIEDQIDESFAGDLVIDSGTFGFGGFDPTLTAQLNELPEVASATGLRFGGLKVFDDDKYVTVIDPATLPGAYEIDLAEGELANLGPNAIATESDIAEEHGWELGTQIPVIFPDGLEAPLTLAAIYESDEFLGNWVVGRAAYEPHSAVNLDAIVLVNAADDVSIDSLRAAVEPIAATFPNAEVQDRDAFASAQADDINQILGLIYTMLALAIIIALLGIANTLALSIHERTRELGLLRAVGMTRPQLRSTVRWESVVIALFGTLGGLLLGVGVSWALVTGAGKDGFVTFTFPIGSLLVIVLVAGLAGVLAGLRPAARAAKLDVLHAIASE